MNDYLAFKNLGNGQGGWVIPLMFGRARIIKGPIGAGWVDDGW